MSNRKIVTTTVKIRGKNKQVAQALAELLTNVQYDKLEVDIKAYQDGQEIVTYKGTPEKIVKKIVDDSFNRIK